ncbi:6-phospho-beta-glucosidase [Micromonospora globispora]|uniref:6-phospho-beta-glucosidase n=1 Tax=Micromonospora globispora TaxID=1450148 RepID=A0A317K588_9ACTN|nr:6-phospho-beta-glucosidase [Micromonospora globispora]PWU46313.1 6-phospho-beta-glucosidase [Micromonospora globispora]
MKIAVVGGGSTYTPELVDGFARLFPAADLCLVDPAADRLSVVGPFAARIYDSYGASGRVTWTGDLDAGLTDASVVILQLRVGGQTARISDETFPLDCGCLGQETTGAGGLAKALRTVPVVLDIAERAARLAAPDAWIVDFTNPVGIVTRALLDAGHRAVGLCNVAIGFQRRFAGMLGVEPSSVLLDHVGLNHLTWERAAYVDGVDRLPELLRSRLDELASEVRLPSQVLATLGNVPSYYLRYFYCHDEVVRSEQGAPTRGEQVARIESELLRMYADPDLRTKPELLSQRGGAYYSEAAVGLVGSLLSGDGGVHAVNVRNNDTFSFLPGDAVIEVTCTVDGTGATPRPVQPLGPELSGLIAAVSAYEELAVDAAVRGGRSKVYSALLAHPLVGQHDLADTLTDKLLAANSRHLAWAR